MEELDKVVTVCHKVRIGVFLVLIGIGLEIVFLSLYQTYVLKGIYLLGIYMAIAVVFGPLVAAALTRPKIIFRSLLWTAMLSAAPLSFFLASGALIQGIITFGVFFILSILSILSLRILLDTRWIRLVLPIVLFTLGANAGWYAYVGAATVAWAYGEIPAIGYLYLSTGLLNLVCLLLSLSYCFDRLGIFLRRTGSVQTNRL